MNEDAMARLRAEVTEERERLSGASNETRASLTAAMKQKQAQVDRTLTAMTDAGHNPTLLTTLKQLQAEELALDGNLQALEDLGPPAPRDMTEDAGEMIHAAAQQIEQAVSYPVHPDAPKLREMVRGMIGQITISRHESGPSRSACGAPSRV